MFLHAISIDYIVLIFHGIKTCSSVIDGFAAKSLTCFYLSMTSLNEILFCTFLLFLYIKFGREYQINERYVSLFNYIGFSIFYFIYFSIQRTSLNEQTLSGHPPMETNWFMPLSMTQRFNKYGGKFMKILQKATWIHTQKKNICITQR